VSVSRAEVQEAVSELHQYLSDQKPPLMVAQAVGLLLRCPPHYLAAQIHLWVSGQVLTAPVADYLYHGAKKISLMGDLDLLPKEALARRLPQLTDALLQYAPEGDRELLREHLTRLGQAAPVMMAAPDLLYRRSDPAPAEATAPPGPRVDPGVRRLALLLDHLRPLASAATPPERRTELASQFMTSAAAQASSIEELDRHLAPLRELGIDTGSEQVFRTLARSLAGWLLPRVVVDGRPAPLVSRQQLDAMSRIVSLSADPAEVAKRFREMVHAAIEQFNEGHLGRAAAMFELAERLATEEKVKPMFVDPLRTQGHEYLDPDRLRKFADRADCRMALRFVLHFFTALTPEGLLKALNGEPQRDRRHQLLALLEAHEGAARAAAWALLKASVEGGAESDPFFQMNLVYLLRIIPRPPEASVDDEVAVVTRTSDLFSPPPLIKQNIAYLAHVRQESAERVLAGYLHVFESMLLQPDTASYSAEELEVLLDRTCAALARYGTPAAWGLLIDHGLKSEARLGSPFVRLAEAGRFDLSSRRDLVERIIAAIRAELPRGGLLGIVGVRNEEKGVALVQALAGTPLPEVEALLQEIAGKYPGRMLGQVAAKSLTTLGSTARPTAAAAPAAGLSGDLELFGLPNLMQTLQQSSLTGILSILDAQGLTQATVLFEGGRFRGGQCGPVIGEEAVYQLFEKPFPGTFAFVSRDIDSQPRAGPPADVIGLLLEGSRRYDEFRRAAAVVPDGARLKPAGNPHGVPADEDADLATMVWKAILSGKAIEDCEAVISIDSYRVRRLAAHWVEEGALQPA
jgi:hypothetical protein